MKTHGKNELLEHARREVIKSERAADWRMDKNPAPVSFESQEDINSCCKSAIALQSEK